MAFRLVSSGGHTADAAFINAYASGVVRPGYPVDFLRTSGTLVGPSSSTSTGTMIFGVSADYAQGASDTQVKVIPFSPSQIWEVDCANAASTGQIGVRHAISGSDRGYIHNTSSDVSGNTGVFICLAIAGASTGSGRLLGRFVSNIVPVGQNQTTYN